MRDLGRRRQQGDERFGVEVQAARIVADEPAHEGAPRQLVELVVLERPDLPGRELELLGDGVDRQSGGFARGAQLCTRGELGRRGHFVGHSQPPVAIAFASAESGYRLRNCDV